MVSRAIDESTNETATPPLETCDELLKSILDINEEGDAYETIVENGYDLSCLLHASEEELKKIGLSIGLRIFIQQIARQCNIKSCIEEIAEFNKFVEKVEDL